MNFYSVFGYLYIKEIYLWKGLMKELLIGDIHFGIKNNSITWLNAQIKFFRDQVFNIITEHPELDRIVFLGDVFDIRSSLNQMVCIDVREMIGDLAELFTKDIIFIAGNHDFYSPLEEFKKYNMYYTLFGKEFTHAYPHVQFVTMKELYYNNELFLPWFSTFNEDTLREVLDRYPDFQAVYCHTDFILRDDKEEYLSLFKGRPIFSGHIHTPYINEANNLYNIGACCSLTFNDVNDRRYVYIVENHKIIERIENVTTPKFKRVYDRYIFDDNIINEELFYNSLVQLCIYRENINQLKYVERIKEIKSKYSEKYNITVKLVDKNELEDFEFTPINTNINQYIQDNIPEHLEKKYKFIDERLKENSK